MNLLLTLAALLFAAAPLSAQRAVRVDNPTGTLTEPANFWTANSDSIAGAINADWGIIRFEEAASAAGDLTNDFLLWSPSGGGTFDEGFAGWVNAATFRSRLGLGTSDTPVFGGVSGNGSGLTALNASNLASGTVPSARLPSASETVVGGLEIASAAEIATGTDNTRAVSPLGLHGLLDPIASSRAPVDMFYSDGATTGRRVEWAIQNMAGSPITVAGAVFRVPTSAPAVNLVIFQLNSASAIGMSTGANHLCVVINPDNSLQMRVGTDGSNRIIYSIPNWRATNSGKLVRMDFTCAADTPYAASNPVLPIIYVDGVSITTPWTVVAVLGTPPAWMSSAHSLVYLQAGSDWPQGEFTAPTIITRVCSAAEIAQMIELNAPLPQDRLGGSTTGLLTNTGLEVDTVGFATTSSAIISRTTADARTGLASLEVTTTGGGQAIRTDAGSASTSQILRCVFWAKSASGNTSLNVSRGNGSNNAVFTLTSSWAQYVYESSAGTLSPSAATNFIAWTLGGTGVFRLDDVQVYFSGALLQPEITRTAQLLDHGPNRIRGIATAGIRPLTDRDPQPLRGNQAATGMALGLGASDPIWYEPATITGLRIKQATASAQTITLRLDTSGGTVIATATTAASTAWQTVALSNPGGFEVAAGNRLHWTITNAIDWDLTWTRR